MLMSLSSSDNFYNHIHSFSFHHLLLASVRYSLLFTLCPSMGGRWILVTPRLVLTSLVPSYYLPDFLLEELFDGMCWIFCCLIAVWAISAWFIYLFPQQSQRSMTGKFSCGQPHLTAKVERFFVANFQKIWSVQKPHWKPVPGFLSWSAWMPSKVATGICNSKKQPGAKKPLQSAIDGLSGKGA